MIIELIIGVVLTVGYLAMSDDSSYTNNQKEEEKKKKITQCRKCNAMVKPRSVDTGRTLAYDCQCGNSWTKRW